MGFLPYQLGYSPENKPQEAIRNIRSMFDEGNEGSKAISHTGEAWVQFFYGRLSESRPNYSMSLISLDASINISLSVKDRHASAEWYRKMLGFETIYHADEAGWSELQTNTVGVTIGLGEHTRPVLGNCVPVFGIADLDAARQKLEQAKVNFDGETDVIEGMVKTATFYDPDGNALMLAEDLTGGS